MQIKIEELKLAHWHIKEYIMNNMSVGLPIYYKLGLISANRVMMLQNINKPLVIIALVLFMDSKTSVVYTAPLPASYQQYQLLGLSWTPAVLVVQFN